MSFVVIVIIMAVMANTMAMTARERYAEYATLKALGFANGFVALLIFAESLGIALVGGVARHRADVPGRAPRSAARWARCSRCSSSREETIADAGRLRRSLVGVVAALLPGVARGARAHRRRPARRGVIADDGDPALLHRAQPRGARKLTTALTAGGMALVVYVFATVLMLAAGPASETLVATGQPDNVS